MSKDLDDAIERYHRSADEFVKGNPEPMKDAFSREADVTLATGDVCCKADVSLRLLVGL